MTYFDRLETRSPLSRVNAQMKELRGLLSIARNKAPALRKQLKDVDIAALKTPADLARVPVIRKSELTAMQRDLPPFGGLAATRPGLVRHYLVSPGPIFVPEGVAKDYWGGARALHAAGGRAGGLMVNCFSYHLTPGGHIMDCAARAIGCATIPAGTGNTEQVIEAIERLAPDFYCGTPDYLKILLDKARELGRDMSSVRSALVSGAALPASLRGELLRRGIKVRQAYASADLGIIAYETSAPDGGLNDAMVVNERVIVEIVTPGTSEPVRSGEVGEIVVTRLNAHYPLLRFATGDLSAVLPGLSPCGRTNMRIRGWLGRADQTTKIKGMFVHPTQVMEIARRHPELARLRLIVKRAQEQDVMTLRAEARDVASGLAERLEQTLQSLTKLRGHIELVPPGSLPNDGKVIADERAV
jgi:phenylacetate-CoA ligase